jgi:hypothetical protein
MRRALLSLLGAAIAAATVVVASAPPAAGHGLGSVEATNVRSRVLRVEPQVPGIRVRVIELGERVELRNATGATVVVSGYDDEPYLRIGPDGVEENRRSPAVYANRTARPPASVPGRYDATAAPEWRRVSGGNVARWHDHRAHYMGSGRPPGAGRGTTHLGSWTIPLQVDGRPVTVHGDLAWVEPPSPWPWLVLAAFLAALAIVASLRYWRAAVATTLVVLLAGEVVHVAGGWNARVRPLVWHLGADLYSLLALAIGIVALVRLLRRGAYASAPWVIVTGLLFVVAGGIADLDVLYRSQTPGSLKPTASRLLVAIALGGGTACIVAGARRLGPVSAAPDRTTPAFATDDPHPR